VSCGCCAAAVICADAAARGAAPCPAPLRRRSICPCSRSTPPLLLPRLTSPTPCVPLRRYTAHLIRSMAGERTPVAAAASRLGGGAMLVSARLRGPGQRPTSGRLAHACCLALRSTSLPPTYLLPPPPSPQEEEVCDGEVCALAAAEALRTELLGYMPA
jgi:hypothetical protein